MASLLRLLAGALLLAAPLAATSAPTLSEPDSLLAATKPEPRPWFRPRHLVLQTGGGLGMVAAGTGYEFWQKRTEVDVLLGFVPARYAGTSLSTLR